MDKRKAPSKSPTSPSPASAKRPGGRPARRGRAVGRSPQVRTEMTADDDVNNSSADDSQPEQQSKPEAGDSESSSAGPPPKKRGRKPKSPIREEDKYVPTQDASKRGIMAEGGGCALRNRQNIRSKARYSPPPFDTPSRGRGAIKFPSTTSTARYKYGGSDEDDEDDENEDGLSPSYKTSDVSPPRRKTGKPGSSAVKQYDVSSVSRCGTDSSKLVVTLPDGTSIKVDASNAKKVSSQPSIKGMEQFEMGMEEDDDGAGEDPDDEEYKPGRSRRPKVEKQAETATSEVTVATATPSPATKTIATYSRATPKQQVVSKVTLGPVVAVPGKTPSFVPAPTGTNLKQTPKFLPTSKANPPLKRQPQASKFIDVLPELYECTNDTDEPGNQMAKLPDKIIFISSELPLSLALSVEHEDKQYLFRQVLSPIEQNKYNCLLCKSIDQTYTTKEEKDIIQHYRNIHELEVEQGSAKFSEEIIFICLPKQIIAQLTVNTDAIPLNAPCQYCGEEARLSTIEAMKSHYSSVHNKQVIMIEQEEIIKMHNYFYCCKCKNQSLDFESHHKHMKEVHRLKSYKCKSCSLITNDVSRLKTHFRAKHLINNANANQQCNYCQGLLIGIDRLNKHIQQTHMVQTGPMEFSCVACLKVCGRGKDLLAHAQVCEYINKDIEKKVKLEVAGENDVLEDTVCSLCGEHFDSQRICDLHQHHVHMKWVSTVRRVVIPGQQIPVKELTIDDVTSDSDLARAKVETHVGHWCRMCDCMVKVYRLYYLHMANYHKLDKGYQCNITGCKYQAETITEFEQHIEQAKHNQKTVISNPDEVFVCTYCDMYFPSDVDLIEHLLTDQHINKFTTSGHFHRTEPRNYKCKACHTFFGMKESYIHHLETENHQYQCPYCGMTTALPSSRRAHIQNSHPEKVNLCEICQQQQSDVLAHLVTHGHAFECKKCIKKFYWREQLNAHMETHAEAIICNWDGCGKQIATRSTLVTHYRQHKSDHKCDVCGQAFWNQTLLIHHQRSHMATQKLTPPGVPMPGSVGRPRGPVSSSVAAVQALSGQTVAVVRQQSPQISNTVYKCAKCCQLFKTQKDMAGHRCVLSESIKTETIGGLSAEEAKVLELAAEAATRAPPVTRPGQIRTPARTPARTSTGGRRQPVTRKPQQQPVIDLSALTAAQGIAAGGDDASGTQVIMILNQETGELMEITAPQGMAVSDVINSLNLVTSSSTDVTTVSSNSVTNNTETITSASIQEPITSQQEQTIMLPASAFNEDGSLTLDAATLSSLNLTIAVDGNGEVAADGNTTFIIEPTAESR